jgi:sugar phosphate isomerase/epimerase
MQIAGSRVVHVHANDHHGQRDEHLAPGNGTVPWPVIGAKLRSVGFSGWVILELNRELSASPGELAHAREQLVARLG